MDEKDWLMLKTLYEQKNITKSAEALYTSQPALSYRIRSLEKEFNAQIITRGKKGIEFTPQGESIVRYADRMLVELRKTKESVQNMKHKVKGTLRLGVFSNFARYRLPILLKQFIELYPDVEFQVKTGFSSEIQNLLFKDEVHIGILRGEFNWKEQNHLLFEEPICIASQHPIKIEDLPYLPRINYKTDVQLLNTVQNWWQSRFNRPPQISMEVDRIDTCVELIKNGLGYAIIPIITLSENNPLYTMNIHNEEKQAILRRTSMLYRDASLELSVVEAFVEFLKNNCNSYH